MYSNLKHLFNYLTYKIILLFNLLSVWVLFQNAGVFFSSFFKLTLGPTMQKSLARWDCIISDRNVSWYSVGTNNPSRPDGTDSSWPAGNWWQKIKNKNTFKIQIQTHKRFQRTLQTHKRFQRTLQTHKRFQRTLQTHKRFQRTLQTHKRFQRTLQTHKRFQRTLFVKTKTQSADFQGNSLYQATKWHLNNSLMVKNNEKWNGKLNHLSVFLVELRCFPVQCLEVLLNILVF